MYSNIYRNKAVRLSLSKSVVDAFTISSVLPWKY